MTDEDDLFSIYDGEGGRLLLSVSRSGVVTGSVADASEAGRIFGEALATTMQRLEFAELVRPVEPPVSLN